MAWAAAPAAHTRDRRLPPFPAVPRCAVPLPSRSLGSPPAGCPTPRPWPAPPAAPWWHPARRTRSSMPDQGRPAAIRSAVSSPMPAPRTPRAGWRAPAPVEPAPPRAGRPRAPPPRAWLGPTPIDVGPADGDPVAPGVGDQALGRPEPHRLGVQQPGGEGGRVVQLEPGRGVHQVGEGHRVALGEPEVGEGGQGGVDLLGHVLGHVPGGHAGEQPVPQPAHPLAGPLGPHGLAELVGLGRGEAGHVDGDLHQLLLEERDAERPLQGRLQQRVQVGDVLLAVAPPDVGMDGVALDGPGPDQGDLDGEVVEAAGLHPGQGAHLGPGLHLEHPHGVGPAQQVVDLGLLGEEGQVDP